jgi:hypothetical protein
MSRKKLHITRVENGYIVRIISEGGVTQHSQHTLLVFRDLIELVSWQARFFEGTEIRTTDSRKKRVEGPSA